MRKNEEPHVRPLRGSNMGHPVVLRRYFKQCYTLSTHMKHNANSIPRPPAPDLWTSSVSTTYTYDQLNHLIGVSQGSQTRSYTYDGMGRLTSSTTPEAGTVSSAYNGFSLVTSTTDARGVVASYSYDSLNRVTGVSYNVGSTGVTGTSSVSYSYGTSSSSNNNGRLTGMSDGTGSESYTYDILGRMTALAKVIGSTTYTTDYAYNLASEVTQLTYPSGRVVAQTYDGIGRLCGVGASGSTCSSGTTYASGYNYNTAGEVTEFNYGNGVVANLSYSPDRLQLHCLQYDTTSLSNPCSKDTSALFMLTYAYGSSGANNGQISGIADGMDNGRTASYTYDGLGRLSTAGTVGSTGYPAWGLSWTYDRYGNRTAQTVTAGSAPSDSLTVSTTTNQVTGTGYSYDADGNMTADGLNTMTYDAASRLISSSNGTSSGVYSYDGKGMRVKKCVPNCSSPTTTTIYVYSGGKVIDEYDNGAAYNAPSRENIYSGGTQIAKYVGTTLTYYHQDHLSNRLVTSSTGSVVEQMGHLPYGDTWYDTGSDKWRFTTYERDAESGNDYAMARYDVSRLGRFSSPDPLSGSTSDPQSLNHYTYVGNDPINAIDPTGQTGDMYMDCGAGPARNFYDQTCPGQAGGDIDFGSDGGFGGGGPGGWGTWADPETACGNWWAINACDGSQAADGAFCQNDPSDPSCKGARLEPYAMQALAVCINAYWPTVQMTSFVASAPGTTDAGFTGTNNGSSITITNNTTAFTVAQISQISNQEYPGMNITAPAMSNYNGNWNVTYTGSNLRGSEVVANQIVELGNSLTGITNSFQGNPMPDATFHALDMAGQAPGTVLLQCMENGGPN
jgi:RHS repeat-associated protein